MQKEVDQFSSCKNFRLNINIKKTEVMYQPIQKKPYYEPHISVKEQRLKAVENFTSLGSTLSRCANIDDEVKNRITKASWAFGNSRKKRNFTVYESQSLQSRSIDSKSVKPGQATNVTKNNFNSTILDVFARFLTYPGMIRFLILMF